MTWLSFDDGYTRERVWEDLPYDTRWHFHAMVELCGATRRYDGRLRRVEAYRCSDVPDVTRSVRELVAAGLVADRAGGVLEVINIDDFLPPEGQRDERLLARKKRNQGVYRKRKCESGEHSKDCPAASCPVKLARRALPSALPSALPVTPGRDGTGSSPKTEGQGQDLTFADAPNGTDVNGSASTAAPRSGNPPDHDASDNASSDDQHDSTVVQLRGQATTGNARERACEHCRETFTPARRDARYCSQVCKSRAWRASRADSAS